MKASDVFFEEEKLFENGLIKKSFFSPFLDRRILIILFVILVRFKPIRLTRIYTGILESVHYIVSINTGIVIMFRTLFPVNHKNTYFRSSLIHPIEFSRLGRKSSG